ncbi:MAG: YfcC family protein, partial [Bacteroidota bacterium]
MKWYQKTPDSLIIVGSILILITGLTWVIPAGEFNRIEVNGRKNVIQEGTYHTVEAQGQGFAEFLKAPFDGFISAGEIIAFVLIVGGMFSIVTSSGAIDAFLLKILNVAKRKPSLKGWVIALLMIIFSIAGMTFGMSEETLVFVLLTIPLAKSMGYDAIVGTAIPFVGAGVGFAGAAFNPFTVGIAQGLVELELFSGFEYRLIGWSVYTLVAILFVLWYCRKLDKGQIQPLLGNTVASSEVEKVELTSNRVVILFLFLGSLIAIIYGAVAQGWYIPEICGLFTLLGILTAIISRMKVSAIVKAFYDGIKIMIPAAMIIALSKSILVVAENGKIIDTILYSVSSSVEGLPAVISVQL